MTQSKPRGARFAPADSVQVLVPANTPLDALVHDRQESHRVRWLGDRWACSCKATSQACGHIQAVRRLLVLDADHVE